MAAIASTGLVLADCRAFLAAFFSKCRPSLAGEMLRGDAAPERYAAFLDGLADVLLEAFIRVWTLYKTGDMDPRTTFALLMTSKQGIRRVAARKAPLAISVLARRDEVPHRAPPLGARLDAVCFRVRWEVDDSAESEHNPCSWLHVPLPMADLARRLSPAQAARVAQLCREDSPFVVLTDAGPAMFSDGGTRVVTDGAARRVLGETQIAALQCCTACSRSLQRALKCERCGRATYCGRECQLKDWRAGHRDVCRGGEPPLGPPPPQGGETPRTPTPV